MDSPQIRPWYRIHRSTFVLLTVVIAGFVFVNIPGDAAPDLQSHFHHGWPYRYYERIGEQHSFWSFAGKRTEFHAKALLLNVGFTLCVAALVACPCELWIRRNGRLVRFGIRSLLVVTALFAALMGLGARELRRCYEQQQLLQTLSDFGSVTAVRRFQKYDWLRSFFGDYMHGAVSELHVEVLQSIDSLPNLRELEDLEELRLTLANVPANVEQLAELPKLEELYVTLTSIDAAGRERLTAVTEVPQLRFLWLDGEMFDDDSILRFSDRTRMKFLIVDSSKLTEKSVSRLSQMNSLLGLTLNADVGRNEDISDLFQLPLHFLTFIGNEPSTIGMQGLRQRWPNANVRLGTAETFTGKKYIEIRPR
jgi:hypothetical protein